MVRLPISSVDGFSTLGLIHTQKRVWSAYLEVDFRNGKAEGAMGKIAGPTVSDQRGGWELAERVRCESGSCEMKVDRSERLSHDFSVSWTDLQQDARVKNECNCQDPGNLP